VNTVMNLRVPYKFLDKFNTVELCNSITVMANLIKDT
jgi:hypothetical protein